MIQEAPGYGNLLDWQTRLSIDDLADANDALDAVAEVRARMTPKGPKP